jgi:hypothetical protein
VRERVPRIARLVALASCVAAPMTAGAAEPELASLVAGPSTCPRPDMVLAELAALLPPERLAARLRATPGAPPVELIDRGVPFDVAISGRVREYRDEARDCTQRARVAAVFVAMTIDPASIGAPAPPPAAPPAAAPTIVASMPVEPVPARVRLELAGAIDAGLGSDRVAQGGLELRLVAGAGRVAFVAGASASWPADTTVGGVRLRQWRVPADAGVRLQLAGSRIAPWAEVSLVAALLSETALDLASAQSQKTIELGARGGLGVRFGASRWAPFAALHAELVPSPAEIYALPRGVAGHTPYIWIGVRAGASVGFP